MACVHISWHVSARGERAWAQVAGLKEVGGGWRGRGAAGEGLGRGGVWGVGGIENGRSFFLAFF